MISKSHMHKMATHCAYILADRKQYKSYNFRKRYILNTLSFLGEIPGKAGGGIWSYSNKNCRLFFCLTISNQNYNKTYLVILGVLTCMLQSMAVL